MVKEGSRSMVDPNRFRDANKVPKLGAVAGWYDCRMLAYAPATLYVMCVEFP
jgi:hypothetical protein